MLQVRCIFICFCLAVFFKFVVYEALCSSCFGRRHINEVVIKCNISLVQQVTATPLGFGVDIAQIAVT